MSAFGVDLTVDDVVEKGFREHVAGPLSHVADANARRFDRKAKRKAKHGNADAAAKNARLASMSRSEARQFRQIKGAKKVSKSAFGVDLTTDDVVSKALTDPKGNMYQRPPHKNTRGQNTKVGATVGGTEYGAIGAGLGAAGARHRAAGASHALRRGAESAYRGRTVSVGSLKRSAAAGRTLSRVKGAGKVGAAGAAVGTAFGATIGAVSPHRKDGKKLPNGRAGA